MKDFLAIKFPSEANQLLHWWRIVDGQLTAAGCDNDPVLAAGIIVEQNGLQPPVIALVSASVVNVGWQIPPEGTTERQALTASAIFAREQALDAASVHVAAAYDCDGRIVTARISHAAMVSGLNILETHDIIPDAILPAGFLLEIKGDEAVSGEFAFETIVRTPDRIFPDEPGLRNYLAHGFTIKAFGTDETETYIVSAGGKLRLNLRCGIYAKKTKRIISLRQKRLLLWGCVALALFSGAVPLLQLIKLHQGADRLNREAVSTALPFAGQTSNAAEANLKLDAMLNNQSRGSLTYSAASSALFAAVQRSMSVSIDKLSYRTDGNMTAVLSSSQDSEIIMILDELRSNGYAVTETVGVDASGVTKADITVRAK